MPTTKHNEMVAKFREMGATCSGFRLLLTKAILRREEEEVRSSIPMVPDAFSINEDEMSVHVWEASVTNGWTKDKALKYAQLWAYLDDLGWALTLSELTPHGVIVEHNLGDEWYAELQRECDF